MRVFWCERTDRCQLSLRRYHSHAAGEAPCPGPMGYHNASTPWRQQAARYRTDRGHQVLTLPRGRRPARSDPRWPRRCEGCGYEFALTDPWQVFQELIYRRTDTGAEFGLRDAPVGALWDAWWMPDWWRGPDGICLMCKTPGGDWHVDGEASNCTDPAKNHDGKRTHYCWVRHGDPRAGTLHVDKDGPTCGAGAGSILAGGWHGFLHHGELVTA